MNRPARVYVAATRQNEGKTTTIVGLMERVRPRFPRVGYLKPVGQQVNAVDGHQVDKDAILVDALFHPGSALPDMSPVAIPSGFTERYIREGSPGQLAARVLEAFERCADGRDFVFVEGTGHAGVGAVIDLSNAEVARLLDAPVILVTGAGIGKPIDEVLLNKALFDRCGVPLLGVIVNKVLPDKYGKVSEYVRLGLERQGVEVLGVLPYEPLLASPTVRQVADELRGELLAGEAGLEGAVTRTIVGAVPAHALFEHLRGEVLLITPGSREDLVLAALAGCGPGPGAGQGATLRGLVLTCGVRPHPAVLELVRRAGIPTILVEEDTFLTARRVDDLSLKIRAGDRDKVEAVQRLFREHLDVDRLLDRLEGTAGGSPPGGPAAP